MLLSEKFRIYERTLVKWQSRINLVADSTLNDFQSRHVDDSLQLLPFIRGPRVLDIGSGAGFPGMVIAMASNFSVTCLDSDQKKTIFLREIARATKTPVNIINSRVDACGDYEFDTICARGFAHLNVLIPLVEKFSGYGVFLKGERYLEEIEDATKKYKFTYETHPSRTKKNSSIIIIKTERQPRA